MSDNDTDAVATYPIKYRNDDEAEIEDAQEEFAERRDEIEDMYSNMTPEIQLDLLLMFANAAEFRLASTVPLTANAEWLEMMSRLLRQLLMVMTHLEPDSPKPNIALEDPKLYWPSGAGTIN